MPMLSLPPERIPIKRAGSHLIFQSLSQSEMVLARAYARRIALYSSDPSDEADHIGEAEIIVLAQRSNYAESLVLLDEQAARSVAKQESLTITGFAGVLLIAVEEGLLTADDVRQRLQVCQAAGTHYSNSLISHVYEKAKGI